MPRYGSQGLHNVTGEASRASLLGDALREQPLIARDYSNRGALRKLRLRLAAAEDWGERLIAAVPTQLMVAATLDPRALAAVFDELAMDCHTAAPPASGKGPSRDIRSWKSTPDSARARADRLIHALTLLGEHVAGCWTWVPSQNTVQADGAVDDDLAWELEYSPPPASLLEVIGSRGVLEKAALQEYKLPEQHFAVASRIQKKVQLLAKSATEDLREKAFTSRVLRDGQDVGTALRERGDDLIRVHEGLVSAVSAIHSAAQHSDDHSCARWMNHHERLVSRFDDWIGSVLPAMPVDRGKRQSLKRDMRGWVGYVAQYALLLRGNAASLELVRMVHYMKHICSALGESLDSMQAGGPRSPEVARGTRMRLDRALVSRDTERSWREQLSTSAAGVGRLIAKVVGDNGQTSAIAQRDLLQAASKAGIVTARATSSKKDQVEAVLVNMQLCGLAAKVPVAVFRKETIKSPRTGPRRKIHAARDWWLNPLGTVLSSRRR
jgi:hypothetical protein